MPIKSTVFAQIMEFVPWRKFQKIIDKYQGDTRVTSLKTNALFCIMAFAQIANKRSLCDTIFTLNQMKSKLYHIGIQVVKLSNIAKALTQRNWKIFEKLGYLLIAEAQSLYQNESNDFDHSAMRITQLYRHRWQVELFFKWIDNPS